MRLAHAAVAKNLSVVVLGNVFLKREQLPESILLSF